VTDAAIVAGHLDPQRFLGGRMQIDADAAEAAVRNRVAAPLRMPPHEAASGVLRLAGARMAQLISEMTVQVGLDPRDYTLVGFGGAGPMFLADLVQEIGAARGIVPLYPSVWSAFGGLFADIVHDYARSCVASVDDLDLRLLDGIAAELGALAETDLARDGAAASAAEITYSLDLRYAGQSHEITVPVPGAPPFTQALLRQATERFAELHEQMFAHRRADPCQLVTVRLRARVERDLQLPRVRLPAAGKPIACSVGKVSFHGSPDPLETQHYLREELPAGFRVAGPAIVVEPQAHTVVPPGMALEVGTRGELIVTKDRG
jgi:N-methylhydantoinase A